jgi:hypothetical protein
MHYFILHKAAEYVIFKVKTEDELFFREKYDTEIVVEADSLMQLLICFEQDIIFSLDYVQVETQTSSSERETGSAGVQPGQR